MSSNEIIHSRPGTAKHAEMVLATLRRVGRPASAYEIQSSLSDEWHAAPSTIYRALERLIAEGRVHRLKSLNAFVACCHNGHHKQSVFVICDDCQSVTEFSEPGIQKLIDALAKQVDFTISRATLELRGACRKCRSPSKVTVLR